MADGDGIDQLLEQMADELGVDPAALTEQLGSTGGDPYAIFAQGVGADDTVGVRVRDTRGRPGPPTGAHGTDRSPGRSTGPRLITETVGEVLKRFYKLYPAQLRRIQALLYAGGFFGNIDLDEVRWGEHDDETFAAWTQAVARTARLNAAGQKVTYEDVMVQAAEAAGLDMRELSLKLLGGDEGELEQMLAALVDGGEEGRVIDVLLSDPNALRSTMDQATSAVLGRKANAAEQRMFISMIHGMQRQGQIARQTAEPGEAGEMVAVGADPASAIGADDSLLRAGDVVTEYAPPDEGATAEALARQQNPEEAGAHDIAMQFATLLEMLPAPVNVPRVTI